MEKIRAKKILACMAIWGSVAVIFGLAASLAGIYLFLDPNLPDVESLKKVALQTPLRVYTIDNKLIGEFGEKRRDPVEFAEVPTMLIDAVLAAEDDAFFQHNGVDIKGLLRAASQLLLSGEIKSGGSTITMQVARNFFLSREQTFIRKFNEILLALKIEKSLSKQDILTLYLNRIYLGNRAYGVKAAAQVYYGAELENLNLSQIAMIAGLPKAPSSYNPIINPQRAQFRRDWILKRMLGLNKIAEEEYREAINMPVTARYFGQNIELDAPYVAEIARSKAVELYGEDAYINGYRVVTTIDSRLQSTAREAVVKGLLGYDQRHGYRGPEQKLDIGSLIQSSETDDRNASLQSEETGDTFGTDQNPASNQKDPLQMELTDGNMVDLRPWLRKLQDMQIYGGMEPAIVVQIETQQIRVLTVAAAIQSIPWENGLATAKPFISENITGAAPQNADDIFEIGDLIRIHKNQGGSWQLAQVPEIEAAFVSLDPRDGSIQSMVGGFDFNRSKFNRVTQARRQPGSNFKPFIYATALEHGLTAASIFNDAPVVVDDARLEGLWRPENASGKFYGPTRLRKALYLSRNLVSIRLLRTIGIGNTVRAMEEHFGMDASAIPRDLSMALGSYVMSPLDVAAAYSVFANGGYRIEPYVIHHIRDRHDKVLYAARPKTIPGKQPVTFTNNKDSDDKQLVRPIELKSAELPDQTGQSLPDLTDLPFVSGADSTTQNTGIAVTPDPLRAEHVIDERIIYIMNSMLKDVINRGTGRRARALGRNDLAGKTGTTNGPTDAWFSGFNDQVVTTTWVGFDDNRNLGRGEYGGVAALPIWIDYMKVALRDMKEATVVQPDGIVTVRIDPKTGKRASASNANAIFELFLEENLPEERSEAEIFEHTNDVDTTVPENLF